MPNPTKSQVDALRQTSTEAYDRFLACAYGNGSLDESHVNDLFNVYQAAWDDYRAAVTEWHRNQYIERAELAYRRIYAAESDSGA